MLELVILIALVVYVWLRPQRDRSWEQRMMRRLRRHRRRHRRLNGVGVVRPVRTGAGTASRGPRS